MYSDLYYDIVKVEYMNHTYMHIYKEAEMWPLTCAYACTSYHTHARIHTDMKADVHPVHAYSFTLCMQYT